METEVLAKYNPAFEGFFESKSFYKILYGSAGSGKSYAIAQKIITRLLDEEGHHAWCFRKVSTYILESVFATLLQVINDFGVRHLVHVNKTNRTIDFSNGNRISCMGLDDEEKIKSILNMTIAWVEEATEFNEKDIVQIDLRMRGESPVIREMILSFNPVSELHWIKLKYFDNPDNGIKKKLFTLHTTYKDNIFLDREYIERLESVHASDPNAERVYVRGEWGRTITGQEYYKWFNEDTHLKNTVYNPQLPVHISWDFNVLPYMSVTVWQIIKKDNIWIASGIEEIAGTHPDNSTEAAAVKFMEKYGDCEGVIVYGDATGRARKTSSKYTDYMIIEHVLGRKIIEMRVPRSNPIPPDVHTFMNKLMYGSLPVRMVINPSMKFLIQDFTHILEDGDRKKVKKMMRDPVSKQVIEKFGHMSATADYFFMEAFKIYR